MAEKWVRNLIFAIAFLAIASALLPWYSHYLGNQALKQAEQGWGVESLHQAKKAVAYNPFSIDALFIQAGAQQRLGRTTEARASLLKAVELQPQNYSTWEQLALYERDYWGDPAAAQVHLARAAELNRYDEQLQFLLKGQG